MPTLDQLFLSMLGGLTGFLLAQTVNLLALAKQWWRKPRLRIEAVGSDYILLDHKTQHSSGQDMRQMVCGFQVRNTGRTPAFNIQAYLLKIEIKDKPDDEFNEILLHTYTLPWANMRSEKHARDSLILLPNACATVRLAEWDEAHDILIPYTLGVIDYGTIRVTNRSRPWCRVSSRASGSARAPRRS
jgi:hypothetical protein